jgi:hypothetical protein
MRRTLWASICVLVPLSAACDVQLTQVLSPSELETSERGAFTSDGRFFVIGRRAAARSDAGGWLVEVTKAGEAAYATTNYVAGALEGTSDGTTTGSPVGDPCVFSGMTVIETRLYAACVATAGGRASLFEVDTQTRTVRTEYFTTCNAEPSKAPCENILFYPNGMAADSAGRIYLSNTAAHLTADTAIPTIALDGSRTLTQVVLAPPGASPQRLAFTHRDWFSTDLFRDGLAPNGVQIENGVLYYAAGANINRIDILADGTAGAASVHYAGPLLTMIDDFVVHEGRMVLARVLSPALVAIDRAPAFGTAPELATRDMDFDAIPSSITYQPDIPASASLFPAGSLVITCYFGGGLYVLTGLDE